MDKDGKLKADEFILAMHLVDLAKTGQPLPLTLPSELVPPSQRYVDTHVSTHYIWNLRYKWLGSGIFNFDLINLYVFFGV